MDELDKKAKMLITTAGMLWKPITLGELDQILLHAHQNLYRIADTVEQVESPAPTNISKKGNE